MTSCGPLRPLPASSRAAKLRRHASGRGRNNYNTIRALRDQQGPLLQADERDQYVIPWLAGSYAARRPFCLPLRMPSVVSKALCAKKASLSQASKSEPLALVSLTPPSFRQVRIPADLSFWTLRTIYSGSKLKKSSSVA